jgi:hypothetical protein
MTMCRIRRNGVRRRGYTLVVFVLLMFGVMGLAAIVIDLGFARLAQRQMQAGVDTAAIEGLRGRDRDDVSDPDASRRLTASEFLALMFDDDLAPAGGDVRSFGAGPVVNLTGGVGDPSLNASQLLSIPATPAYKPQRSDGQFGLEMNMANERHGDLVAGSYDPAAAHHNEDATYQRSDFDAEATEQDAFLARMRRTNDFQGLDDLDGVSSRGPAVPILFGRASLLAPADPSTGYSPRHHGVTARATAIAQAQRAKAVGRSNTTHNLPGALPFVFHRSSWESDLGTGVLSIEVNASGELLIGTTVVGYVTDADGLGRTTSLGDVRTPAGISSPATFVSDMLANLPASARGYVAVVPDPAGGTLISNRVIGFGLLVDIAADSSDTTQFVIVREVDKIASENATGVLTTALDTPFHDEDNDPQFVELWQQHNGLEGSLLAPVLVR